MTIHNCLVIDNSSESTSALSHQLQQIGLFELTYCTTWDEGTQKIRKQSFDLIFLDIDLCDQSGLTFLKIFTNLPPIIIVTANPAFAVDTYDIDAVVDYLLKPIDPARLYKAINRGLANLYTDNCIIEKNFAFFKVARKVVRFDFHDISHVAAYGVYSKIFYNNQMNLVNEPISALEKSLPKHKFKRVHKSYIINIQKVTGFDHKYFYIDSEQIPIGISYRPQLEGLFRLFGSSGSESES
ncbi:LytR/AlgR family response regulator transcription factor [Spirosoma gilvum]